MRGGPCKPLICSGWARSRCFIRASATPAGHVPRAIFRAVSGSASGGDQVSVCRVCGVCRRCVPVIGTGTRGARSVAAQGVGIVPNEIGTGQPDPLVLLKHSVRGSEPALQLASRVQ